ncbi:hypothetical protein QBC42DRAFT_112461 [Cladorrhinum samala]|uniref:Uncharacterized protein n=1 Tax=Cladorrhinum samala TaxID=585594 RepID=A0AAV9HHE7_9PEZI|nr:hypothetical protein QBC42DRAFT_112461 [Cladorrhinum samala]
MSRPRSAFLSVQQTCHHAVHKPTAQAVPNKTRPSLVRITAWWYGGTRYGYGSWFFPADVLNVGLPCLASYELRSMPAGAVREILVSQAEAGGVEPQRIRGFQQQSPRPDSVDLVTLKGAVSHAGRLMWCRVAEGELWTQWQRRFFLDQAAISNKQVPDKPRRPREISCRLGRLAMLRLHDNQQKWSTSAASKHHIESPHTFERTFPPS